MKNIPFSLLCGVKTGKLQPLWRLEEFRELLGAAPELPRSFLKCRLTGLLPVEEQKKSCSLTLPQLLLQVWRSFFADTIPAIPQGSLAEAVLSLCRKYSWSPDWVLELPYPVFEHLLGIGQTGTAPAFTAEELAAAKARLPHL